MKDLPLRLLGLSEESVNGQTVSILHMFMEHVYTGNQMHFILLGLYILFFLIQESS